MPNYQSMEEGEEKEQIVVPPSFRKKILEKAHADLFSGHSGISKTKSRIGKNFFWPGMKGDIVKFCKTCHECQVGGKLNQPIPKAPLQPIVLYHLWVNRLRT